MSTLPLLFVGHPYASIGKGEELRSAFSAFRTLDPQCAVLDIYRHASRTDPDHVKLLAGAEVEHLDAAVRVFHINGDEVTPVLAALKAKGLDFAAGKNIIVPAWELPRYPDIWVEELRKFDEIWAISEFVRQSLMASGLEAHYIGQAAEVPSRPFLPRRYFGVRASSFVFLTLFDLSSFSSRKNPWAVIEMYRLLRGRLAFADMQLVVKVKQGDRDATAWIEENLGEVGHDVVVIDRPLTAHETQSLIAACDCFVSLHRSEGFGRGAAEAMWLGRSSIATAWSGNLEYMDGLYPGAVGFTLIPVAEGDYPCHEGQHWAEPNLENAVDIAERLVVDSDFARRVCREGQRRVRRSCSFRAVGIRMLDRVNVITEGTEARVAA